MPGDVINAYELLVHFRALINNSQRILEKLEQPRCCVHVKITSKHGYADKSCTVHRHKETIYAIRKVNCRQLLQSGLLNDTYEVAVNARPPDLS